MTYSDEAIEAAVSLSVRHLKDLHLPDKAIDVLDEAGAAAKLAPADAGSLESGPPALVDEGASYGEVAPKRPSAAKAEVANRAITVADIERIVAKMARVPVQAVSSDDKVALKNIESELRAVIFGQDAAIDEVASAIKLSRSGLRAADKPMGNFLFAGPTGVGKTELARQLAARPQGRVPALRHVANTWRSTRCRG